MIALNAVMKFKRPVERLLRPIYVLVVQKCASYVVETTQLAGKTKPASA
jgi:hypothetical protein